MTINNPYLRIALLISAIGVGTYLFVKFLAGLLAPFILALFFALAIEPLVRFGQNRLRLKRSVAVLLAMVLAGGVFFFLFAVIIQQLVVELIRLSADLPRYSQEAWSIFVQAREQLNKLFLKLPASVTATYPDLDELIRKNINQIIAKLQGLLTAFINSIVGTIAGITGAIVVILVALVATYFLSRDRERIVKWWVRVLPPAWGEKSLRVVRDVFQAIIGYGRAQLLLIINTMILTTIGLYLIGAPYALTMGIIIGLFDLLPVLGPGSVYVPWMVISLLQGKAFFALKLGILYVVVLVFRQLFEAKVVSANIGLHPLVTLISMYVGLKLLGVWGLPLGPIVVIAAKAVVEAAGYDLFKG
ncbi:MAG: hypothetical protein PWQ91_170 [Eubacteriales bacterium]|nr:hypothetical protein [Eubacteriales bacterium]MDN5363109.1 hypothetical protein [Eubacteriales bacterium]